MTTGRINQIAIFGLFVKDEFRPGQSPGETTHTGMNYKSIHVSRAPQLPPDEHIVAV